MSFFSNPIANISGGIHDLGKGIANATKNPLVDMAAAAALDYFTGGAGELVGSGGLFDAGLGAAGNAALVTGGIAGLASGNLAQGLMAGMAGYGGASLGEGLGMGNYSTNALNSANTANELSAGYQGTGNPMGGPTPAQPVNAPANVAGDLSPNAAPQISPNASSGTGLKMPTGYTAPTTTLPSLSTEVPKQSPFSQLTSWFGKQDLPTQLALGAAGVYGLKSLATPQKLNAPNAPDTRFVKYYSYNPMGGYGYQGQTPAVQAASAATGGLVALAKGGGVHHYDDGGSVASDPVAAAIAAGTAGFAPGTTAQDVVTQYGLNATQAQQVAQNLGYTGDLSGLNYGTPAAAASPSISASFFQPGGQGAQIAAQEAANVGAGAPAGVSAAAPQYTQYSPTQMANYIQTSGLDTSDPAALAAAIAQAHADPAAVQKFLASGADPYSAQSLANPLQANVTNFDAQLGTKGATTDIKNAVYAAQAAAGVPGGTANSIAANTQLAHEMDAWGVDPGAMANAVGMSKDAIQALYNQVNPNGKYSTIPKTITNTITNTITGGGGGGGGGPQTSTILPTNPQTNAPAGTKNPYGNINNPGDLTYNPNGTTTVTPNVPGRPYGGFSGVGEVTNAYTAGGGSTGYTIPTYQNMDQFNAANNTLTGGSKAAYDYLMGKTPWNPLPTTPTGQVSVPYAQLMGQQLSPQYQVSTPQIYDPTTHTYITNPNYDPAFSATKDYLGVQQTGLTNPNALKVLGYTKLANGVMGYPNGDGTFTGADGKKYNADGTIFGSTTNSSSSSSSSSDGSLNNAKGGLLGLASGGMSVGHLGGYSDGGRLLRGPGDGVSDSIPATIGATDPEPARLADGEFVVPARIVSELGNGSTEAGARQLYKMMDRIQTARRKTTGKDAVATNTNAHKYLPA